jgi:hypothetical protein
MRVSGSARVEGPAAAEAFALRTVFWIAPVAALASWAALKSMAVRQVPIFAPVWPLGSSSLSIALLAAAAFVVAAPLAVANAFRRGFLAGHRLALPRDQRRIRMTVVVVVAECGIFVGVILFGSQIAQEAFAGLTLGRIVSAALVGALVGAAAYRATNEAYRLTPVGLFRLVSIVLLGGVFVSMLFGQPGWWRGNFSALGIYGSAPAAPIFNLSLLLASLLFVSVIDLVFATLDRRVGPKDKTDPLLHGARLPVAKALLATIAVLLGGVGLFPYIGGSVFATLHNLCAFGMMGAFVVLIGGQQWIIPGLSREFDVFSALVLVFVVGAYWIMKWTTALSLTAFELLAFTACFVWLGVLMKNLMLVDAAGS